MSLEREMLHHYRILTRYSIHYIVVCTDFLATPPCHDL
jgi:hypothetical protein